MRPVLFTLLAFFFAGCASPAAPTKLIFSGAFELSVPSTMLEGAVLLSIDGLTLRTNDGDTLTGTIITHASESLPESLNLRVYPELVLTADSEAQLDHPTQELLDGIRAEIDFSYGLAGLVVYESNDSKIYRLCKLKRCLGYATKAEVSDHLLMIHTDGLEAEEFDELLREL
ncbi:MAG: hypothetical protein RBS88_09090 [Spongiibacteraceae bacterium]|nr:hypothetical protein [Spongiibacteraceae bacterium]